jgi:modification methylase
MQSPKSAPKVAFGQLVEAGYLNPGAKLFDRKRQFEAMVRADGSILCGVVDGSIHKVGSSIQNAPSCNGWTYWHYAAADGAMKPIDDLRQTYLLATEP